jgi:hypothetical protein
MLLLALMASGLVISFGCLLLGVYEHAHGFSAYQMLAKEQAWYNVRG